MKSKLKKSCVWKFKLLLFLLIIITNYATAHRTKTSKSSVAESKTEDNNLNETPNDHRFFLKQIFDKYGHQGIISFEGFEHLLENLGLGRLVFEKSHNISLHKVNGSFQEVHDSLRLHEHSHEHTTEANERRKREAHVFKNLSSMGPPLNEINPHPYVNIVKSWLRRGRSTDEQMRQLVASKRLCKQPQPHNIILCGSYSIKEPERAEELITSYSEPLSPGATWSSHCLTPQDILETFGLEPHHNVVISPHVFLNLCPAIIYELDQRSCYSETKDRIVVPPQKDPSTFQYSAWLYATVSVLIISLIGLLGVAMVPLVQINFFQQVLHFLVALAVGTMCGDALLHLLPHALIPNSHSHSTENDHITPVLRATVTFLAIVSFFLMEAILHNLNSKPAETSNTKVQIQTKSNEQKPLKSNRGPEIVTNIEAALDEAIPSHQHSHHHGNHSHKADGKDTIGSVAWMVIMGDGLHNLTDGLAIGAAFSGDIVAGFATAVAVLCHELPHELGDFAVLLQAGMSIKKAVVYNVISSVLSFIGMAIGVWVGEYEAASLWIYAFTAGTFLYISLVDLIPEINNYSGNSRGFLDVIFQLAGIITGAGIMLIIALYEDDLNTLFN